MSDRCRTLAAQCERVYIERTVTDWPNLALNKKILAAVLNDRGTKHGCRLVEHLGSD
jgi:hypothetical protein